MTFFKQFIINTVMYVIKTPVIVVFSPFNSGLCCPHLVNTRNATYYCREMNGIQKGQER